MFTLDAGDAAADSCPGWPPPPCTRRSGAWRGVRLAAVTAFVSALVVVAPGRAGAGAATAAVVSRSRAGAATVAVVSRVRAGAATVAVVCRGRAGAATVARRVRGRATAGATDGAAVVMAAVVAGVPAARVPAMSGVAVGVECRDVVVMPLGPRGVAGGHGAVPVRAITVPGAGKRVSVLRAGVARSRGAGHERRGGRCGRRADRCGGRRRRGHRARGRAMTHTGRALAGGRRPLAGGGPMAGAWPPIGPRPPGRCPAPRGGTASGEGGHERRAVARCPASAVRGCAPGGPAPLVTVLGRCVECCRCRSAVSRGW